ncbi:MAG: hypothetical protein GY854_31725 [Deltaproteobacteria bacterium]|nr:hypothetical protein [Deltaproteobacteria bacterium]
MYARSIVFFSAVSCLTVLLTNTPSSIEKVIKKSIARKPSDRYNSAAAMRDELDSAFQLVSSEEEENEVQKIRAEFRSKTNALHQKHKNEIRDVYKLLSEREQEIEELGEFCNRNDEIVDRCMQAMSIGSKLLDEYEPYTVDDD